MLEVTKVTKRTQSLRIVLAKSVGLCSHLVPIPQYPDGRVLLMKWWTLLGLVTGILVITKVFRLSIYHCKMGWGLADKILTSEACNLDRFNDIPCLKLR